MLRLGFLKQTRHQVWSWILVGSLLMGASQCTREPDPDPTPRTLCTLAEDQEDSFFKPPHALPMEVRVAQDVSEGVREKIRQATEEWNGLAQRLFGLTVFKITTTDLKTHDFIAKTACTDPVQDTDPSVVWLGVVHDERDWRALDRRSDVLGIGLPCRMKRGGDYSVLLLNGMELKAGSVLSVLIHELGHVFGLAHSCAGSSAEGNKYALCRDLQSGHPYLEAVMYPRVANVDLSMPYMGVKEQLRSNDKSRGQCMLQTFWLQTLDDETADRLFDPKAKVPSISPEFVPAE